LQRQSPATNRAVQQRQQALPKVQAQPKAQTPRQQQAQPKTPSAQQQQQKQASPLQPQRQERALRQREDRELRALPARQRAQRREQITRDRAQRAQQGQKALPNAKSNIQVQPNAAVAPNAQSHAVRRNGFARVTPQAAQQGRFAGRFAVRAQTASVASRSVRVAARRAWRQGRRAAFVSWIGPVFWPYAYSDVFDYAFWPDGYDDGYWAYAYDDFFDGMFWGDAGPPEEYGYAPPPASASTRASYAAVQELCKQPGTGITAWPFAEIEKKVGLKAEQKQLLADVRNEAAKAASVFKVSCPAENAFPLTPPGRLQAMTGRLQATLEAVQVVRPALEKFYDSLSDEQKERFNQIGPKKAATNAEASQASAQDAQSCKEQKPGLSTLPIEKIDDVVKPTDAQAADLNKLQDATDKAVSILQGACPEDTPLTPPGRLEAMEKRLQAMIDAASTVRPALDSFYASLSSEQKARFNRIGQELARSGG
jgi:hypothetical protein